MHKSNHGINISGKVEPGLEKVRKEFEKNFNIRGEVGAAFAVYQHGKNIIDLWGGLRDQKKKLHWESDTVALVCSSTKGISAAVLAMAQDKGWIDYNEKVAKYWPEFAQRGKENITLRELFSHQAGLTTIDGGLDTNNMSNLDELSIRLARQKPRWRSGDYQAYHAFTVGLYMNEIIRRTDPQKRTIGQVLQDEIVKPMNGSFYIGLPHDFDSKKRLAQITTHSLIESLKSLSDMPKEVHRMFYHMFLPWTEMGRITLNVKIRSFKAMMDPHFLQIESPAANGVGDARTISQIYGSLAYPSADSIISEKTLELLKAPPTKPRLSSIDRVLGVESGFSLGFFKPVQAFRFGSDHTAFGCLGGGGSFAFADPSKGIGYAYVPNLFNDYLWNDPRERALHKALYECL